MTVRFPVYVIYSWHNKALKEPDSVRFAKKPLRPR
jgi:hypothetical protein